ncbi:hypothetical protein BYT27DRAFT_7264828 [Phlegmacium glaucopus]|nr:hypothetical protein BYT27DRAFT_7264828 [Phlegmacium glaucopus]
MKLEFFASPPPSANLPLVPRLSVLPRDDQELQEPCAKVRVLEVRPVEYAKLILDLEERHAEFEIFLPKLQAKLRKLQDKLTDEEVARVARERRVEAVGVELDGEIVSCEKEHGWFKEVLMTRRKSRIKNIMNGYPECKKNVATVEKREHLETLKELFAENHVETETQLYQNLGIQDQLSKITFSSASAIVNASATSHTPAMMSLDLNLQFAVMKDVAPAKC